MVRLSRISTIHLTLFLFALLLVGQAARVQLVQGDEWAERARRQQFRSGSVAAPRGDILDASGNVLAESRELFRLNVAPREVKNRAVLARALGLAGFEERWIQAAGDSTKKWVTFPGLHVASEIAGLTSLDGVHAETILSREYVAAPGIRRIVGSLDARGRAAAGIELALDSVLRGDSARASVARDVRGRRLDSPGSWGTALRAGNSVTLTINRDLQEICERALTQATDSLDASGGDIVVLNPATGEVLAMASRRRGQLSMSNTAVTEPFEPGSTLKPFIAAALLERKRSGVDEVVETYNGEMVLGPRRIIDIHKAPRMTLSEVIRFSSNIGIVRFAERLSAREKFETLRDLGFGAPTGIPLPGEAGGTLYEPRRWSGTTAASIVMGYEVAVTPLQLAAAYASLANGGELMQPHIIREIRSAEGDLLYRSEARVVRRVFREDVTRQIRRLLTSVVDSGTAVKADLASFQLAGKSGTARRTVRGQGYVAGNYTASFVGLFPADKPQYVVVVKLDSPRRAYYGGDVAAPVTAVVLRAALAARDAALDRGDLARVGRDVPLPGGHDSADAATVKGEHATLGGALAPEPELGVDSQLYSERTPRPAKLIRLPFAKPNRAEDRALRAVPDVRGLATRSAVRALHVAGFRVALVAGLPVPTVPAAGALRPPGTIVKLQHIP